eukprot:5253045-Pyramimonas_sp.AAC.2
MAEPDSDDEDLLESDEANSDGGSESEEPEDELDKLELILGYRVTEDGTKEYQLKWEDLSYRELSWMPESQLAEQYTPKYRAFQRKLANGTAHATPDVHPSFTKVTYPRSSSEDRPAVTTVRKISKQK